MWLEYPPLHFGMPLSVDSILHSSVKFAWNFIDDVGFHETVNNLAILDFSEHDVNVLYTMGLNNIAKI
jgi:hypothetical protein